MDSPVQNNVAPPAAPEAAAPPAVVASAVSVAVVLPAAPAREPVVEQTPAPKVVANVAAPVVPRPAAMVISAQWAPGYYVSVGAFAVSSNANHAYLKLQNAGLSAVAQTLTTRKGALTRVGVGPFRTQAEARTAAKAVGPLKLDALVVKH